MTTHQIESVAVVGAGALGGMYAAHFVEGGLRTSLVASGERAARLRDQGVRVNGRPLTAAVVTPLDDDPHAVDLVLVAVKHHQLRDALEDVAPFVGPRTTLVSVLNGLESEHVLAERFAPEQVLACIALGMAAGREGTEVTYLSPGRLSLGTTDELGTADRLEAVQGALTTAGLAWEAPADMAHEMWWKFMVNTAINQSSAVLRAPYADFTHDGPARSLMLALVDEVVAVAAAEGITLDEHDRERWDEVLASLPGEGHTSMLQDVLAGRPTEVALFADHVLALGARHGVETPYNQSMSWILTGGRSPRP